jgi:hypothetical protein
MGSFPGAPSNEQFVFQMIPAFALNENAYAAAFKLFNWTNVGIFTTLEFLDGTHLVPLATPGPD